MASIELGCVPLISSARPLWKTVECAERVIAALLLALTTPILLPAMTLIAILSRRSPLVAHSRVGFGGKSFWVLKLRTMWNRSDSLRFRPFIERLPAPSTEFIFSKPQRDARVTSSFASLCRRYSIDELPQLWQVLRGEMSLVGPRPLTAVELERFYGPDARRILTLRPGLTGLWQLRGRSRLSYAKRRRLDLFLVRNWCVGLYFRILLATPARVLSGRDAW